jgi:radical SAM protein with 4Fe4S-binding SPASM domain
MSEKLHPSQNISNYRRIIAAATLGSNRSYKDIGETLVSLGISTTQESAEASLKQLHNELISLKKLPTDCHLHITNRCRMGCTHCFSSSVPNDSLKSISPEKICEIIREASSLQFRRVVLSGGEPLEHPLRDQMLEKLAAIRMETGACFLVLRTNLFHKLDSKLLNKIENAVDQIVVSIDGDPSYHDSRRFYGAYESTLTNLKFLLNNRRNLIVRIAGLVDGSPIGTEQSEIVRRLAIKLGIESVVIRQPKPLGRAIDVFDWTNQSLINISPKEAIRSRQYPLASCAIGSNIHIESDLNIYPCFATVDEFNVLGSLNNISLTEFQKTKEFTTLLSYNVDRIDGCRTCQWRYLCGGKCNSWSKLPDKHRFIKDKFCNDRKNYAYQLLLFALNKINISINQFESNFGIIS